MRVYVYRVKGRDGQAAEAAAVGDADWIVLAVRQKAGLHQRFAGEARNLESWCERHGFDYQCRAVEVEFYGPPTRGTVVRIALRHLMKQEAIARASRRDFVGVYCEGLVDLAAAVIGEQTGGLAAQIRAELILGLAAQDNIDALYERVVRVG